MGLSAKKLPIPLLTSPLKGEEVNSASFVLIRF
jgi:hypothetical protein